MPRVAEQVSCTNPKVSVAMITYNHEEFVAQAIEGVLMQEVGFEVELVIGEDCSTDGTRRIVNEYKARYPGVIRTVLHERNLGARINSAAVIDACRGECVAWLEGDDYWTDARKLQKQIAFLDDNSRYSACFHEVMIKREREAGSLEKGYGLPEFRRNLRLQDLTKRCHVATCSMMFRRRVLPRIPEWMLENQSMNFDWATAVVIAESGDIAYLDETMAVYRVHPGGMWSRLELTRRREQIVDMLQQLDRYLKYRYRRLFRKSLAEEFAILVGLYASEGNHAAARTNAWRYLWSDPWGRYASRLGVLRNLLRAHVPATHGWLNRHCPWIIGFYRAIKIRLSRGA